jgi:hypothetical protein
MQDWLGEIGVGPLLVLPGVKPKPTGFSLCDMAETIAKQAFASHEPEREHAERCRNVVVEAGTRPAQSFNAGHGLKLNIII